MKKTVLIDQDGVLANLVPTWFEIYGSTTNDWIHPDVVTQYDFQGYVKNVKEFDGCLSEALETCTPIPGSLDAMRWLCANYDVKILTYLHPAAPYAHRIKVDWLARWFPGLSYSVITVGSPSDKALIRGDVFIDDSQANIEAWREMNPAHGAFYLFKSSYGLGGWDWPNIVASLRYGTDRLEVAVRHVAMDELTQLSQELGLYDDVEAADEAG